MTTTIHTQTAKLVARIAECLPSDLDTEVAQGWIDNPQALKNLLRGLVPLSEVVPDPEPPLDFTVRVDRSVSPAYPDWSDKVMHSDLECTGPAEYNLKHDVEKWRHDDQKTGVVKGVVIYDHLKAMGALTDQLGLTDLLAIQKMGIAVFRALFKGETVFGWKSVVRFRGNRLLFVPYLYEDGDEVVLFWHWLGNVWGSRNPALRFRK